MLTQLFKEYKGMFSVKLEHILRRENFIYYYFTATIDLDLLILLLNYGLDKININKQR